MKHLVKSSTSGKLNFSWQLSWRNSFQILLIVLLAAMAFTPAQTALAAAGTFTVNRADDIAPRGTGVTCITAASSDCTLREAVIKANANPGSTIQFATSLNGTPIVLTIIGNDANANAGDLDINASTNIVGNGSANTIIQGAADASYTNSIGDKVFGINQNGLFNSLTVNFSGLTIRYGDNNIPTSDPLFAYTGGGVDVFQTGAGNVATFTDCVISFNRNRNGYGGGFNFDQGTAASGSLSFTNVTFDNNKTLGVTGGQSTGGAMNIFGVNSVVTINNSTFTNNLTTPTTSGGGAIYFRPTTNMNLLIHNSDFNGNTSGGNGGGIYVNIPAAGAAGSIVTIDQGTQIRNNVSGGVSGGSAGGSGLFLGGGILTTTPMLIDKVTISGNHDGASATSFNGGGGILVQQANVTIQYSRIVNNTVSGGSSGAGLFKNIDTGTVTATNNWWGCSTGPGATPCDTAVLAPGSAGSLNFTPYLRVATTPTSPTIVTNQTTALTASVNSNSAGASMVGNVDRLLGLPVAWSAVNGTISGADATINNPAGTASATFTATAAGAGKGIAKVDNDSTSGAGSNIASITINKANTTAVIGTDSPDPSVTGQPVTVTYSVTGAFGNSPTAPTGNVTVSDGADSCTGTVAAGSCLITFTTAGAKTLTATYAGDANFNASPASVGVSHTVNKADTTTTISSDTPDPSVVGQSVTFNYSVAVTAPGAGTPTGNVTVTDGTNSCTGTVAAGSCLITFTAPSATSFTATYAGDANFNASPASPSASHTVNKADTTTTITSDTPDPSAIGGLVTFNYSVAVTAPGAGTPSGNVTVSDGTNSCIGTVGAGSCTITLTTPGTTSFTATYEGDTNFNSSASASAPHTVNKADTTTALLTHVANPSVVGESVTVTFSVTVTPPGSGTPSGNVTVSDGVDSCVGSAASGACNITLTTAGLRTLTATYAGDTNFNGSASAGDSHTVNMADTTTSISSDLPDPSVFGQAVTVNYSVLVSAPGAGTPTGNVTVSDGTDSCTGTAAAGSCSITFTSPGAKTLTATYAGDANFNGSTSAGESHTVNAADTTTTITADTPDPSIIGETVTINYTVAVTAPGSGVPTGNVTVSDGTQSCVASAAAGSCTIAFSSQGAKTLTATYAGDSNFNGSASATESHTVNQTGTTTTITSNLPNPSVVGQAVTVSYSVSVTPPGPGTPTGNVTVSDGVDSCVGTVGAGSCSITLSTAGVRTLIATYAGDSNFGSSASAGVSQTVNQAPSITSADNITFTIGSAGSFTVTTSGYPTPALSVLSSPALPASVSFVDNGDGTATLSGTPLPADNGTYALTITANNGILPNATQNFTLTISQGPAITSADNTTFVVDSAGTFTVTTTGNPIASIGQSGTLPSGVTFADNGDGTATLSGTPATGTTGTYNLVITASNGILPNAVQNFTLTVDGPPAVSLINSVADTGDGQISQDESTAVAITQLLVVFNKSMNSADAQTLSNFTLVRDGSITVAVDSATYDNPSKTSTLNINGGAALPDGAYDLTVKGTIKDSLGFAIGADFVRHFFVDTTPPNTTIDSHPTNPAHSNSASFTFSSSELNSTFECQLDGGGFSACASPQNYSSLALGDHTFDVRATDATLNTDPTPATFTWLVKAPLVQIFADVPLDYWAALYIQAIYDAGITTGCGTSPLIYCPENSLTRAEMAVMLKRGIHGGSYVPPVVPITFSDTSGNWAQYWIEDMKNEGLTSGCGNNNYCPDGLVTRAQMAVFLLRLKHGSAYTPPPATGIFTDVPVGYWAADWIEELFNEGITSGCGAGTYCPDAPVTRAQIAVFFQRTLNLPLP